jgi:hypothetical protein
MTGRVKQKAKQVKGGAMGSAAKLAAQRQAAALNKSKRAKKNAKVISSEEDELDKGSGRGEEEEEEEEEEVEEEEVEVSQEKPSAPIQTDRTPKVQT